MRTLLKMAAMGIIFISLPLQAGTINAGFYFTQECLAKMDYKPLPKKLTFVCTKEGQCMTGNLALNSLLLCAQPFGKGKIESESMATYSLSRKGLEKT